MSALGNAKEILLSPGLRILHDNLLGLGGTAPPPAPGAPPPSSSAAPPQPEPEPSSRPGPSSSSSSKAPPPGPPSSSSWYIGQGSHPLLPLRRHRQTPSRATTTHGLRRAKARVLGAKRAAMSGRTLMAPCGKRCPTLPTSTTRRASRVTTAGSLTRTHPARRSTATLGSERVES